MACLTLSSGYPLTQHSIRPFNEYEITSHRGVAAIRRRWNRRLSSLRIFVEHAFGRLKGRFPILRRVTIRDLDRTYKLLESLLVLHNILEERGDDPESIEGYNGVDDEHIEFQQLIDEDDVHVERDADRDYRMGILRRKLLVDLMLKKENR